MTQQSVPKHFSGILMSCHTCRPRHRPTCPNNVPITRVVIVWHDAKTYSRAYLIQRRAYNPLLGDYCKAKYKICLQYSVGLLCCVYTRMTECHCVSTVCFIELSSKFTDGIIELTTLPIISLNNYTSRNLILFFYVHWPSITAAPISVPSVSLKSYSYNVSLSRRTNFVLPLVDADALFQRYLMRSFMAVITIMSSTSRGKFVLKSCRNTYVNID